MKITIQDARTSVTLQQRDFRVTISGARGPAGPQGDPGEGGEWGTIVGDITEQTDLYTALQSKVPYTGATQDVNLGEYGAQLGNLEFDTTPTNVPTTAGSVYWNDTDGTLNLVLKGGQTISRIGETQHIRALNNTGAQIARGKVVYVVGAQGQRLTIALADADTEILSKDTIGFTAEAIADGAEGFVIVQGVINNVSTTGMADGATVFLSQTAGSYTTTPPADPAHLVVLGFIVNGGSGGAGSIYVKVDNGYELEELHGVADAAKVTPVGADALLLRDSADNNLWKRLTWTNALAGVKTHMDTFKSVAGGYASLDGSGKVPASELPSYVDDVVEVANYAALPGTGETGKIYVTLDTNKCYRWSGSVYVEVSAGGGVDTLTTTGTSGAATLVGSTLNIPQYQGVLTNPVTGTGTAGQVAYFSGTSAVTGSANLFWDAANGRLGIGTNSPTNTLVVRSSQSILSTELTSFSHSFTNTIYSRPNANATWSYYSTGVGGLFLTSITNGNNPSMTFFGTTSNTTVTVPPVVFCGAKRNASTNNTQALADTEMLASWYNATTGFDVGTRLVSIFGNGSMLLSSGNAASAKMHIVGSGTTSATTALLVQNSSAEEILTGRDDGQIFMRPNRLFNTDQIKGRSGPFSIEPFNSASNIRISTAIGATNAIIIGNVSNEAATSGSRNHLGFDDNFAPTSGTASRTWIHIPPTINQTGGANGITRGLYVNPTLTAAADWRSIETSNNTGYAIYTAGTANSYFGGNVGVGTASPSQRLDVNGAAIFSTGTSSQGTFISGGSAARYTSNTGINTNAIYLSAPAVGNDTFVSYVGGSATSNIYMYWNSQGNINTRGSLLLGASDGTGVLAGPSARLHVRGSGTTSATTALLVQNSTPTELFKITDDGAVSLGKNLSATTQSTASIVVTSGDTDTGIAIVPKGTGAITAQIPNGTITGGNARGANAVDLQTTRNNANQVASASNSVIIGGLRNTVAGSASSVVGGESNSTDVFAYTFIGGGANNTVLAQFGSVLCGNQAQAHLYGQSSYASGRFGANSDAQKSHLIFRNSITGTSQTELFLNGSSLRAIINISNGPTNARAWNAIIQVVAIVATAGAGGLVINECFMGTYGCGIKRVGATTSLVGTVETEWTKSDTNMATSVVTIDADDTNEALRIQFTPPTTADGTTVIRVVATAYLTEVGR